MLKRHPNSASQANSRGPTGTTGNPRPSGARPAVFFANEDEVRAAAERGRQQIVKPTLASLQLELASQAADFDAFASIVGGWKRGHREELDEMRDSVLVILERVSELLDQSRESDQRFDWIEEALGLRRGATR